MKKKHARRQYSRTDHKYGDPDFLNDIFRRVIDRSHIEVKEELDFIIEVQRMGKPKNNIEMMLLTKLASSYLAAVKSTHAFACTDEAEHFDGLQREARRSWQAFIDLLGILKRYRAGEMDVFVDISIVTQG